MRRCRFGGGAEWIWVIAGVTAALAFLGGLAGAAVNRRAAQDLEKWRRREETMRMLRWGVELASSGDESTAYVGVIVLKALLESELLQEEDYELVEAVTQAIALTGAPDDATVVESDDPGPPVT